VKVDMVVSKGKVVIPRIGVKKQNIAVAEGKIVGLLDPSLPVEADLFIDAKGNYVLPGVIEPHAHIGDKDYLTETKSAAIGGVTTVLNHVRDVNSDDYDALYGKIKGMCEKQAYVDFSVHFGLITQTHLNNLDKYINKFGVTSFKFFMNYRGEEGKHVGVIDGIDDGFMFDCFLALGKYRNTPACVHAENIEIGWYLRTKLQKAGRSDLLAWEENKPDFTEAEAIRRALYLGEIANCPIYIVHLSSKKGLDEIREYRNRYRKICVETCPHYLTLTSDSEIGVLGKTSPPLRYKEDVEALWQAVADGMIDTIGSDHVPRKKATKSGTIWEASGGYPGVATLLPILLSEGFHKRGITIERIVELTSYNVAKAFNLYPQKGTIEVGADADFTIVDLDLEKEVRWNELLSLSDYSIYEGWKLKGWPIVTIVRGKVVMENGEIRGEQGYGKFIPRFQ